MCQRNPARVSAFADDRTCSINTLNTSTILSMDGVILCVDSYACESVHNAMQYVNSYACKHVYYATQEVAPTSPPSITCTDILMALSEAKTGSLSVSQLQDFVRHHIHGSEAGRSDAEWVVV